MKKKSTMKKSSIIFVVLAGFFILASIVFGAVPAGPTLVYKGNSTSSRIQPTQESNASISGGIIATIALTGTQQDIHWKAYVGNMSGSYVLEDAANYSIYEWTMNDFSGEVYATRTSTTIAWNTVACAVASNVTNEMIQLQHNSTNTPGDSLNDTFDDDPNDHWGFYAGPTQILNDTCAFSINPWVNDTAQSSTDYFEEILLQDSNANIMYVSKIEKDVIGYRNDNTTYDFQMLVAENGSEGAARINYYFYVELS